MRGLLYLKMTKMVNVILCIFYHNKRVEKLLQGAREEWTKVWTGEWSRETFKRQFLASCILPAMLAESTGVIYYLTFSDLVLLAQQ